MSSDRLTPYSAHWLNRAPGTHAGRPYPFDEDPWISVRDHPGNVVYGEDASPVHTSILTQHNGANVWINPPPPPTPPAPPLPQPPPSPPPQVFTSKADLETAVTDFDSDAAEAIAKYGPITAAGTCRA